MMLLLKSPPFVPEGMGEKALSTPPHDTSGCDQTLAQSSPFSGGSEHKVKFFLHWIQFYIPLFSKLVGAASSNLAYGRFSWPTAGFVGTGMFLYKGRCIPPVKKSMQP